MTDDAQQEPVGEQEDTCKDPPSGTWISDCLYLQADGPNIDIVAVHDIGGHWMHTWTKEEDPNSCWLPEVFPDARIMLYDWYDSSGPTGNGNVYTRQGIYDEANRLLTNLRDHRESVANNQAKRSIVFISNGIGGLIVKAAFVLASRNAPIFEEIVFATRAVIFIDYPTSHSPESIHVAQEQLALLPLQRKTDFPRKYQSRIHNSLSASLHELENLFIHANIRSHAMLFDVRLKGDRPVPHESSLGSSATVLTHLPYSVVQDLEKIRSDDFIYGDLEEHQAETLRSLSSHVPPTFPSTRLLGPAVPSLDNLLSAQEGSIVHIQSDADGTRSAEFVYQYLLSNGSTTVETFRFHFNSRDIRFNNITAMLRTWICQIAFRGMKSSAWATQRGLSYVEALQAWTGNDLLPFWLRFITDHPTSEIIYVIGGLDQCDSSKEYFLSSLKRFLTDAETRLRIVFTTTKGPDADTGEQIRVAIPPDMYQETQVDSRSFSTVGEEDWSVRTALFFQQHPRYVNTQLRPRITEILGSSELDDDLKNVVASWLSSDHLPLDTIQQNLTSLIHPIPELVFECILSDMPVGRQGWARQLLFWALHSVRALRTEEFWVLSQIILTDGPEDSIQGVLRWFGGLLRIEYDEVQLGDPRLRAWLDSGHAGLESSSWWNYESERQGHLEIVKTCFDYLRDSDKHVFCQIPPGLYNVPYAIQYWHMHYEAVFKEPVRNEHEALTMSATRLALELFADSKSFQSWIEAYVCLTDQVTTPDPSSKRPFPIASHFGLYDVMLVLKTEDPEDLTDALIEAAKNGHLKIVRHLIPLCPTQFRLSDPKLEKLVKAAASCGNDEIMGDILNLIPRQNIDSEAKPVWISHVLLKACWLGNERLVDVLLDLGADPRTNMQDEKGDIQALHLAIQTNRTGVVKMLLERDASLCLNDPLLSDMLGNWASQEVAELLIANGFKDDTKSEGGFTALQLASAGGRPMIADLLLAQRHDLVDPADYINPSSAHPFIFAAADRNLRTMKVLLKGGIDVNAVFSESDQANALCLAVEGDRLDICELLVEHKIDVNYAAEGSDPPIIRALSCPPKVRLAIVRLLLENGADPERTEGARDGSWGRTALLLACGQDIQDTPEIIKLLLQHSADMTTRDSQGWTPAFTAAYFGCVDNLRLLIDAKADLYAACDNNRWNTLQCAFDQPEVLRLLLDQGMDPFEKYEAALSALQLSARNNEAACLTAMLERSGDQKESAINEALRDAVSFSCPDTVRLLLDEGSDVNRTDEKRTLLSLALEEGNDDIIRMLLEFRPQLDHEDLGDKTLLHYIGRNTTLSSLKLLANSGAKLDGLDDDKESPLSNAVFCPNIEAVRFLLTKPAVNLIVNICGRYGSPLHQASRYTSVEMVRVLVENGADVHQRDRDLGGRTPLSHACMHVEDIFAAEKEAIITYLLEEAGAKLTSDESADNPIHMASLACSASLIKLLLSHGADTDGKDETGRKPIHLACYNSLEALESLNPSDQDFVARDKLGRVPLHFAVLSGELDLVKHVLERSKLAGLDIDVADSDGWTPLLCAARGAICWGWSDVRGIRADEVTAFLLENGANPANRGHVSRDFENGRDEQWSAGDIAAYYGLHDLAARLDVADPSRSTQTSDRPRRKYGEKSPNLYCEACFLELHGTYWNCEKCFSVHLCFKCYKWKEDLHPNHDFETRFGERDEEEEKFNSRMTELPSIPEDQHQGHHSDNILDDEVVSDDDGD